MIARLPMPLVTAALALAGALAATIFLYLQADAAVATMLDQRLTGAGTAASLLVGSTADPARLRALMEAESLDGAFLIDRQLRLLADTNGRSERAADLLRVDPDRVNAAFAGTSSIGGSYDLGGVRIRTGYFPVRDRGAIVAVLGLEAGVNFSAGHLRLERALAISVLLAILGAGALALVAARQVRAERSRQQALARAARAELLTQIAAAAAHEIRNPLGVIRGTVELMLERVGPTLAARERAALGDVLSEVQRLKQLTEDLLDLSADRPLALAPVALGELLGEAVKAAGVAFPGARFELSCAGLPAIQADAGRLRQVFANLLQNSGQASPNGVITLRARADAGAVRVQVSDDGPGIPPELAPRLFEPFASSREGGTGLGLAVSRRFIERHGGKLQGMQAERGACFEVTLPLPSGAP